MTTTESTADIEITEQEIESAVNAWQNGSAEQLVKLRKLQKEM